MRALILSLLAVVLAAPALAADLATAPRAECNRLSSFWLWGDPESCPSTKPLPACDAPQVVRAARAFVARAEPVYLEPEIAEIGHIREARRTLPNPSPLARRYCEARVVLTDGSHATTYYFLQEDANFVALGWKVYVCVGGRDRWRVYDGDCRVARPAVVY